jgi:hypothetical protein
VDLVGAQERVVQAPHELGAAVRGVEALVRVRVPGEVRVGGDLPAAQVDRLQAGLDHLHRLAAGKCSERRHVLVHLQELPEPLRPEPRQRVLDVHRASQPLDFVRGVRALDPLPAR